MCAGSSQSDVQLSMIGGHCGRRVASFSGDEDEDRVVCDSDFPLNFGVRKLSPKKWHTFP